MTARTRGTLEVVRGTELHGSGGMVAAVRGEYWPAIGDLPDAARLVMVWNALEGFDDPTVTRLAAWLERYNGDELNAMMDEEDIGDETHPYCPGNTSGHDYKNGVCGYCGKGEGV